MNQTGHITDPIFTQTLQNLDYHNQANHPSTIVQVYHQMDGNRTAIGYQAYSNKPGLNERQQRHMAKSIAADLNEKQIAADVIVYVMPIFTTFAPNNPYPTAPTGFAVALLYAEANGGLGEHVFVRKFRMNWDKLQLNEYKEPTMQLDPLITLVWEAYRAEQGVAPDDDYGNYIVAQANQMLDKMANDIAQQLHEDPTTQPLTLVATAHNVIEGQEDAATVNLAYFTSDDLDVMIETTATALQALDDGKISIIATQGAGENGLIILAAQCARRNGTPYASQIIRCYRADSNGALHPETPPACFRNRISAQLWRQYYNLTENK